MRAGTPPTVRVAWYIFEYECICRILAVEVMPASDYRAIQNQVRELHRLLGKKTLEAENQQQKFTAFNHEPYPKSNGYCRG